MTTAGGHGHADHHGFVDPAIVTTARGLRAVGWSFAGLMVTAGLQAVVVVGSGSIALLADTIHNVADAATAIPLGVAFLLARRGSSRRFTYGLGRVEDFAGLVIVVTIAASALAAAWQAVWRLVEPRPVAWLPAVMLAAVIGFAGNEIVAVYRIRVGRQIGSAALIADGYHARVDGWTSLAVLAGALAVWAGHPVADAIVGLLISAAIVGLLWQSARAVVLRMLDGIDPGTVEAMTHAATHVPRVAAVTDVRGRWIGHRLHAEVSVTVPGALSVADGHEIAKAVRHELFHHLPHLGDVLVHVDPEGEGGHAHHRIAGHAHDGLPAHSHE